MRHTHIQVVGLAYHTHEVDLAFSRTGMVAELQPEPTNIKNPNAVKVLLNHHWIGYVPDKECLMISRLIQLKRIESITATGTLKGKRTGKPWVRLEIEHRPILPGKRDSGKLLTTDLSAMTTADDIAALTAVAQEIKAHEYDLRSGDLEQLRMAYRVRVGQLGGKHVA